MGVIHRDIKPANVFLCNDGNTKVLDFGIAKAVAGEEAGATQLTEAGQMIGTPQYMAPEQVRGTGAYPATDLYALGLLTAEMVNGTRVVKGAALIDVYMVHISEDPLELGAVLNSPIAKVVERATAKSIEERYKSATEMIRDLELAFPALGGQPLGGATTALSSDELFGSRAPSADGDEPAVDDPINNTYDMLEATVDDPPGAMDGGTVVMPQDLDAKLASMIAASTPPAPSTPGPSQLNNTVAMIPDAASLSAAIERAAQRRSSASGDRISSWPPSMPQSAQPYSVGPHSGPHHSQPVAVAPPRAPTAPMQMGVVQPSPYPSGEHPSHSGERPSLSGDVSRSSLGPAPPPRRSQRRSSLGWWLLLLVLLGVGVGVYLWAP
jgi:serine/threonine protein kinase